MVTQLRVDHAFTLLIGDATVVRIETPFRLRRGKLDETLAGDAPHDVGAALPLLHQEVSSLQVRSSGALHLVFGDGSTIDVAPTPEVPHETWQITQGDWMWVGLPGGGVGTVVRDEVDGQGRAVWRQDGTL